MPQTYKDYAAREIAVYLCAKGPGHGGIDRAQEGDIIVIRAPYEGIGAQEASMFMWLRVEGLDRNEMDRLIEPWTEPLNPTEQQEMSRAVTLVAKRRYCIPLLRLKLLEPRLDIARARNKFDEHQPFLCHDRDNYLYLTSTPPLSVHGLIYDKALGRYL